MWLHESRLCRHGDIGGVCDAVAMLELSHGFPVADYRYKLSCGVCYRLSNMKIRRTPREVLDGIETS